MATKKFRCNVCGYIHEGTAAPDTCPVCGAPASEFTELKKKGLLSDTNSNAYILLYSTVMVVVVATLLAVASLSLQKRQYANELNEKKQSILASLSAQNENYDTFIDARVLDAEGQPVEGGDVFALLNDLPKAFDEGRFPIFQAADGRVVIPVTGSGLWGPIWGYVALEKDMNTIAGIVMAHKGETPGLGAEIATPKYQAKFVGKQIFDGNDFVSVKLRKGGAQDAEHEVDAISGGTKTSDGVTAMLYNSLGHYLPLLQERRGVPVAPVPAADVETASESPEAPAAAAGVHGAAPGAQTSAAEQVSNDQNTENNE